MTLLDYGILTKEMDTCKDGHESEFKALDPEGIPKNVSLLLSDGTPYLCTSYEPSSRAITPIARRTRSGLRSRINT